MKSLRVQLADKETTLVLKARGLKLVERDVVQFERMLGHALPGDYREFLLRYNGGRPLVEAITGRDDDPSTPYAHDDGVRVFYQLCPAGRNVAEYERLRPAADWTWELPGDVLPVAEDGGGNLFVLELGRRLNGFVRFVDHEAWDEPLARHRVMGENFLDLLMRFRSVKEERALARRRNSAERRASWRNGGETGASKVFCKAMTEAQPSANRRPWNSYGGWPAWGISQSTKDEP